VKILKDDIEVATPWHPRQ